MSETKESGPTVYKAMDLFQNITQASAFTSKEVALFYTLLQAWNAGRRPAVIEQWAGVTCLNAGLTLKTLSSARNKLVQKGVIYFEKTGNRSAPKYSLDALFGKPSPLLSILTSKRASKGRVNGLVKGDSKQGKEKEKEKEAKASCPASPDILPIIWKMVPQISRTRSSQVKVKKAWEKIKPTDRPTLELLTKALDAWNETAKWKEGYAEGLHIWINDQQWLNIPEVETNNAPSGSREIQFGGRKGNVIKLES